MELREFCRKKLGRHLFFLSLIVFALSLFLSSGIYMSRIRKFAGRDLENFRRTNAIIDRSSKIVSYLKNFSIYETHPDFALASFLDFVERRFPQIKLELSNLKMEGIERVCDLSLKGEGGFKDVINVLGILEEEEYPVVFVRSVSLSKKEGTLSFDIKAEIRLVSLQDDKRT